VAAGAAAAADFTDAFVPLAAFDEPTLVVFPDAALLDDVGHGDVVDAALTHCQTMQDRFTLADVRNALLGGTENNADVTNNFRNNVASDVDLVKYGAAFFPYVRTSLPWRTDDAQVTIVSHAGGPPADAIADNTPLATSRTRTRPSITRSSSSLTQPRSPSRPAVLWQACTPASTGRGACGRRRPTPACST